MLGKDYDAIDLRNARTDGYWIGAIAGVVGTLILCLLLGIFVVT